MSKNDTKASNEWMNRPDDERYWSLADCYAVAELERQQAAHGVCLAEDLRVSANDNQLFVKGNGHHEARLTNWSYSQVCGRAGAPAHYLKTLPSEFAAQALNIGLTQSAYAHDERGVRLLLLNKEDGLVAKAITSTKYERLWDSWFLRGFMELQAKHGWKVPPARPNSSSSTRVRRATEADVLKGGGGGGGLSIRVGDLIAPAGIYRGDRDMFIFMVDDNHVIEAGEEKLARGFFFWNSEVGARTFGASMFLYRSVCGNHIVWGSKTVAEVRFKHIGQDTIDRARDILEVSVKKYLSSSSKPEMERIAQAKRFVLGDNKEEVVEFLLGRKGPGIPKKTLELAYDTVEENPIDGDPNTAWGMMQGVTRVSQTLTNNQDARDDLDRKASKILEFAF